MAVLALSGLLDKSVSTSVALGLAWNLWQTVWILPLFNLGRKRQSYSRHGRRNPQKTTNRKVYPYKGILPLLLGYTSVWT